MIYEVQQFMSEFPQHYASQNITGPTN